MLTDFEKYALKSMTLAQLAKAPECEGLQETIQKKTASAIRAEVSEDNLARFLNGRLCRNIDGVIHSLDTSHCTLFITREFPHYEVKEETFSPIKKLVEDIAQAPVDAYSVSKSEFLSTLVPDVIELIKGGSCKILGYHYSMALVKKSLRSLAAKMLEISTCSAVEGLLRIDCPLGTMYIAPICEG